MTKLLNKAQKEAIGLLQIGTFLEYFDLMLYVHMAVLLNELFFPKTDPHTASLIVAFAFCSTYVLRPFGALVFGYIGDNIGRKATVILTTMMMSLSCIAMATVPTYAQIGITAAWVVTLCRIIQGMSSMGEIIGAQVYISEAVPAPHRYFLVGLIGVAAKIGGFFALLVATFATAYQMDWRNAFWIGACIAVVGSVARTRLRETPDFLEAKKNRKKEISSQKEAPNLSHILSYFVLACGSPIDFYFSYIYCGVLLKNKFGYSAPQVIAHNLRLSLVEVCVGIFLSFLALKVNPLKIIRIRGVIFGCLTFLIIFYLPHVTTASEIFILQSLAVIFSLSIHPATPIVFLKFPTLSRFTYSSVVYATSRAIMHIISAFGLVYLTEWFGYYGLAFIMVPASICFFKAVRHFEKNHEETSGEGISYLPSLGETSAINLNKAG